MLAGLILHPQEARGRTAEDSGNRGTARERPGSLPPVGNKVLFRRHLVTEQEVASVGYAKDQWLKEMEPGYRTIRPDRAVCDECFVDEAVQQFILDSANETKCSFANGSPRSLSRSRSTRSWT
jgi:hypothetical protein